MFQFRLWIFSTVLPKVLTSIRDGQWGKRLAELPLVFQRYANGDITLACFHAYVFSLCIFIHTFPDLTILKEVSGLNTIGLVQWYITKFLRVRMARWVTIWTDADGAWLKPTGKRRSNHRPGRSSAHCGSLSTGRP